MNQSDRIYCNSKIIMYLYQKIEIMKNKFINYILIYLIYIYFKFLKILKISQNFKSETNFNRKIFS